MKNRLSAAERALFTTEISNVKKIKQDTVAHPPSRKTRQTIAETKQQQQIEQAAFYFSDVYQPNLQEDPIRYSHPDADPYEIKKLKRGFYDPDLFLDLHGLTQLEAKQEIAALLATCIREHLYCGCIMYGHGKNILKKQTPMWLAQHPNILCFHQAPKEFGGSAALLFLIKLPDNQ